MLLLEDLNYYQVKMYNNYCKIILLNDYYDLKKIFKKYFKNKF